LPDDCETGESSANSHAAICDCPLDFDPLPSDFFPIAQPEPGDSQLVAFERAANRLAPNLYL